MKKVVFTLATVLALGSLMLLSSCKKECECTVTVTALGITASDTETLKPEDYDAKSCSQLAKKLKEEVKEAGVDYTIKCK